MLKSFARLGITVLERGWLSSNNVVIQGRTGTVIVDTGYDTHALQTVRLAEAALEGRSLDMVVNTHLHSDHCGGNAALHARWPVSRIHVPIGEHATASEWDESALTFKATGQRCERFPVHDALRPGTTITLGDHPWEIHAAPGHDPAAVMLFQRAEGVLISGDALWEDRVSVIFPALEGHPGFDEALGALKTIEALRPRVVIPGHGRPFTGVDEAIHQSRSRLSAFLRAPDKHARYAVRALTMFHMLERRRRRGDELMAWIKNTPVLAQIPATQVPDWVEELIDGLVADGALERQGPYVSIA